MSKEITFNLPYREEGEKKSIDIKIDFVSNYCIKQFNMIVQSAMDVKNKWDNIVILSESIAELQILKPNNSKDQIILKLKEIDKINSEIMAYETNDYLKNRYELVKQILKDNGCKNEMLMSYDFWDRQVDPEDLIKFIKDVVNKDTIIQKKN